MSKALDELKAWGFTVFESEAPDREEVDFTISDKEDNVAWVWGTIDSYEVECNHELVDFSGDETERGECVICGQTCDWHYDYDEDGCRHKTPHEWHPEEGDGGLIKKYIEETSAEKQARLKYLQDKERVCGLDKDELWELTELEKEAGL